MVCCCNNRNPIALIFREIYGFYIRSNYCKLRFFFCDFECMSALLSIIHGHLFTYMATSSLTWPPLVTSSLTWPPLHLHGHLSSPLHFNGHLFIYMATSSLTWSPLHLHGHLFTYMATSSLTGHLFTVNGHLFTYMVTYSLKWPPPHLHGHLSIEHGHLLPLHPHTHTSSLYMTTPLHPHSHTARRTIP